METRSMYRRPKYLGLLLEIRQQMAREADYDVDLFAEMIRSGKFRQCGASFREEQTENDAKASPIPAVPDR